MSSAVQRRILNHTASKSDVLHWHCVSLSVIEVSGALEQIQKALTGLMMV